MGKISKENNVKARIRGLTVFLTAAVIVVLILMLSTFVLPDQESKDIAGRNTFTQYYTQADGSVVKYYATGDEYFHYAHDENGFILQENDGYLCYAREENGRPVATSVKANDSPNAVARLEKMGYDDIDFDSNPDLSAAFPMNSTSTLYEGASETKPIVNIVICIFFSDETPSVNEELMNERLNGADDSLRSYYQALSYGSILINNITPEKNEALFIYKDSNTRAYYSRSMSDYTRQNKEKALLNSAVNACKSYIDVSGLDLDIDDDNFVDAVNFLVSGTPDSWGYLLWPHSWNLNDISGGNGARIGGLKVGGYSFNFLGELTVGLLCHEFGHVLGLEDYYHYDDDGLDHCAVGDWDLMHFEGDTPQFMSSYLRDKYLGVLGAGQIATVSFNGSYSLKPVTMTGKDEIIAYRINSPLRSDEYFMVEYRNNSVTMYDSTLPGSGLVVYRVCTRVVGNVDAKKKDPAFPDELYYLRPARYTAGGSQEQYSSRNNLRLAYLSTSNPYFSSVGNSIADNSNKYDSTNIYFTDGTNSGIRIVAGAQNDSQITFTVSLSGTDSVPDDYFDDVITVGKDALGANVTAIVNDSFSGVSSNFTVTDFELSNLKSVYAYLYNADGKRMAQMTMNNELFLTSYNRGTRTFLVHFVVNDKGNASNNVFYECDWLDLSQPPTRMEFYVVDSDNDSYLFSDSEISQEASWDSVLLTHIAHKSAVYASKIVTATTSANGRLNIVTSNEELPQKNYNSAITVAAGNTHLLFVTGDMRVTAVGFGLGASTEMLNVSSWQSIIKVAVSDDVSYGLTLGGEVLTAGATPAINAALASWNNIVDISAGKNIVVGVYDNGRVVGLGGSTELLNAIREWRNVVSVAVGDNFVAGVKSDGTVVVAGSADTALSVGTWNNIKKLAAGTDFLIGLKKDGTVVGTGKSTYGQLLLSSFSDIIDIAAGMYHTVLLREDGVVQYTGVDTNGTIDRDNSQTGNLIYYQEGSYIYAEDILLPFATKTVKVGEVFTVNATVVPQNSSYKKLSYRSSDPDVLDISASGMFTALAAGTVTVTVTHKGDPTLGKTFTLTVIVPIETDVILSAGYEHSVILNNNGTVLASGSNTYGQLNVNEWGNITYVAAGGYSTVGVTEQGTVVVAGALSTLSEEVAEWRDIVTVAVSESNIVGVDSTGKAYAVGDNTYNQVSTLNGEWLSGIKQVSASGSHILALNTDGSVLAAGSNNNSQVTSVSNKWQSIEKVVAGDGFSLGLSSDGTIYSAGKSTFMDDLSQLGTLYEGIVDLAVGPNNICLVRYNGNVIVLGSTEYSQQNATEIADAALCAVGREHVVLLKYDGTTEGCGRNGDKRCELPAVDPIKKVALQNVEFVYQPGAVQVGMDLRLTVKVTPYNAYNRDFVFGVGAGDETYLSVDANGVVRGLSPKENATVTLTYALGNWDSGEWTSTGSTNTTMTVRVFSGSASGIEVLPPARRAYSVGDNLDLSGGELRVRVGIDAELYRMKLLPSMIANYDTVTATPSVSPNNTVVTVSYMGQTTSFEIAVVDTVSEVVLDLVPLKTEYVYGEELELNGGKLRVERISKVSTGTDFLQNYIANGLVTVEGDTEGLGERTVIIKYKETYNVTIGGEESSYVNYFYEQYVITVRDDLDFLTVTPPSDALGFGEGLKGNVEIAVTLKSGQTIDVEYDEENNDNDEYTLTVTGFDAKLLGGQTMSVSYYDKNFNKTVSSENHTVTVADTVEKVEITSLMLLLDTAVPGASDFQNYGIVYDGRKNPEITITAAVTFVGGYVERVGFSDDATRISEYLRLAFPDGLSGTGVPSGLKQNRSIDLMAKTSVLGEDTVLYSVTANLYCLQEISSISFVDDREGEFTEFTYRYGETPLLKVKIITVGENDAPVTIFAKLDVSVLGVDTHLIGQQTVAFSILGKTATRALTFVDYIVDMKLPADNTIEVAYGNTLTLDVFVVMASGVELQTTEYTVGDFYNQVLGAQTVRITVPGFSSSRTVIVTVIREITGVSVKTYPRTNYEVHDPLDMSKFALTVYFSDNTSETVFYEGNEQNFIVDGYKQDSVGTHRVTVTYKTSGDKFSFNCIVENKIVSVKVDTSRSKSTYIFGEELSLYLVVEYEDGRTSVVTTGFSDDFDSGVIGEKYVNITYFGEYTTIFQVKVIDVPEVISLSSLSNENTHYLYGQTLNLKGVMLVYTTKKGERGESKLEDFDASCFSGYNPTPAAKGPQKVTFTHPISDSLTVSFNVYFVDKASSDYLTAKSGVTDVTVDRTNSRVFLEGKTTFAELREKLSSYLTVKVVDPNGTTLSEGYNDSAAISSRYTLQLFNDEETKIEIFSIYVKGDCNADGEFTADDIPIMAQYLTENMMNTHLYCDINGDKLFDILDLTLWVARTEAK